MTKAYGVSRLVKNVRVNAYYIPEKAFEVTTEVAEVLDVLEIEYGEAIFDNITRDRLHVLQQHSDLLLPDIINDVIEYGSYVLTLQAKDIKRTILHQILNNYITDEDINKVYTTEFANLVTVFDLSESMQFINLKRALEGCKNSLMLTIIDIITEYLMSKYFEQDNYTAEPKFTAIYNTIVNILNLDNSTYLAYKSPNGFKKNDLVNHVLISKTMQPSVREQLLMATDTVIDAVKTCLGSISGVSKKSVLLLCNSDNEIAQQYDCYSMYSELDVTFEEQLLRQIVQEVAYDAVSNKEVVYKLTEVLGETKRYNKHQESITLVFDKLDEYVKNRLLLTNFLVDYVLNNYVLNISNIVNNTSAELELIELVKQTI